MKGSLVASEMSPGAQSHEKRELGAPAMALILFSWEVRQGRSLPGVYLVIVLFYRLV